MFYFRKFSSDQKKIIDKLLANKGLNFGSFCRMKEDPVMTEINSFKINY